MFVREWMSAPAIVVSDGLKVKVAYDLMEKRGIRRFPVIQYGKLCGIVTRSDLMTVLGPGKGGAKRGSGLCVSDVMARNAATVEPGDTLEFAASLMLDRKVSGLPVVEGSSGRVKGVITESDLFRALCQVLGIGERGARVVFSIADGQDVLGVIRKRLNGLAMRSLVTLHDSKKGYWDVVLRVRGRTASRRQTS